MKVFIVLSCVFACALASGLEGYGGHYEAAPIVSKVVNVNNGHSTQSRKQDAHGNYAFAYDEQHHDAWGSGGSSREERGDAWGNKEGSYSLNVGDGRQRVVKYVADGAGFRASIKTNEPGIVASAPAATSISTPHGHDAVPAPIGHAAVATNVVGAYADAGHGYGLGNGLGLAGGYGNGLALGAGLGAGLGYGNAGLGLAGGYGNGLALGGAGLGAGLGGYAGGLGLGNAGLGGYGAY